MSGTADVIAAASVVAEPDRAGALPRRLGATALMLIIVAFNAPIAAMAGFAQLSIGFGNGIGAPVSFLVAGAILLIFSIGFVGMSRFIRNPGAFYQFIVAGIGREAGLAGAFIATAAYLLLCAGSYLYMGVVVSDAATRAFGRPVLSWSTWSLLFVCLVTLIGLFRIDVSMKLLGKLVLLEVALVAVWQAAVLARGGPEGYVPQAWTPAAFMGGSAGLGVLFAMVCMIGIEAGACFSAETRDPERTVGRATYLSILFMTLFYGLGTWLYIVTQGASKAVESATRDPVGSFFASVQTYLGTTMVHVVSVTLVTSQMVAITSVQGSASRYLFALGRDRVFPPVLARVHPRLESPYVAVGAVAGICLAVLALVGVLGASPVTAYATLTGMGIYFLLPLMIATSGAVIAFYARNPGLAAGTWTRLVAPALAAVALTILFVQCSLRLPLLVGTRGAAIAAVVTVAVVAILGWSMARFFRRRRPAVYALIGNQ